MKLNPLKSGRKTGPDPLVVSKQGQPHTSDSAYFKIIVILKLEKNHRQKIVQNLVEVIIRYFRDYHFCDHKFRNYN